MSNFDYLELAPRPNTTVPIDARLNEILNLQLKWLTLSWAAPTTFPNSEVVILGGAMAAFHLAVVTQTQVWDPDISGVPNYMSAVNRATQQVNGIAAAHLVNGGTWGRSVESSLWAGILGEATMLLGNYLSTAQLTAVLNVVADEADYRGTQTPHYMYAPDWTVLTPGDTGAEDNAWNGMAPAVAYCMMPTHPHAQAWLSNAVAWWASAYSHRDDLTSGTVVNGTPISDRLAGYNVEPDYTVTNHDITPNPDYMSCISLGGSAAVAFGLAGRPVPEAAFWNADRVYAQLSTPLPAFAGQTIYLPGQPLPSIFYPDGNDWGTRRPSHYAHLDQLARHYRFDGRSGRAAGYWERVHVYDLWMMQHRYSDGHVFADNTEDKYGAKEQLAAYHMATGWLATWLAYWGRTAVSTASL